MNSSDEKSNLEHFISKAPLYETIDLPSDLAYNLIRPEAMRVRGFCVVCGEETIYLNDGLDPISQAMSGGRHLDGGSNIVFHCQKDPNHKMNLAINSRPYHRKGSREVPDSRQEITKIGQYPSLTDMGRETFKHLRNFIEKQDYIELNRASGLASHGVNIGALTYLRRIFERLVVRTAEDAGLRSEEFMKMRMDERIDALKGHLPEFVIEERRIYSKLSQGLHEGSEDDCAKLFSILNEAILLIFEDKKAAKERADRKERVRKALGT